MARHIMLNGKIMPSDSPCLSYNNRGVLWGDSFSIQLRGNSCIFYDYENYFSCLGRIAESFCMNEGSLTAKSFANDICLLLRKNRIYKEFVATITIFRDSTGTDRISSTDAFSTLVSVESLPHEFYSINKDGIFTDIFDASQLPVQFPNPSFNCELIAGGQMAEKSVDDLIVADNQGNLRRSLRSDIFFFKDKSLVYASNGESTSVNAVFSSRIMQLAKAKLGMDIYKSAVNDAKLKGLDSMFLADPVNGIRWVLGLGRERFYKGIVDDIAYEVYSYYKGEIEQKKRQL